MAVGSGALEDLVAMVPTATPADLAGRRVLVTGHSGFKGTWITHWLVHLGAQVVGFSLPAKTDETNVISHTAIQSEIDEVEGDIRSHDDVARCLERHEPALVIHMAAQALVRRSYEDPVETFTTNVVGTANILDVARKTPSVVGALSIASDKCYNNPDTGTPHSEGDPLGGDDPYSASKGAAEIIAASFASSFYTDGQPLLATARAGNVVGAGDLSRDRIVPDIVRMISSGNPITLRNPDSIRPWQHVLEPLYAYLTIGAGLLAANPLYCGSWNIGPAISDSVTVRALTDRIVEAWGADVAVINTDEAGPREARHLTLATDKLRDKLGISPVLTLQDTVDYVVDGYRSVANGEPLGDVIGRQIGSYSELR